jgi:DNA-binding CsgD family transcriptional regulator
MNNDNQPVFTAYGSINIIFRYGDLPISRKQVSDRAAPPAITQSTAPSLAVPMAALEDYSLSPRQEEVLRLLVQGCSNKQIARTLGLAQGTVKIHAAVLFHKLGVTSRTAAAVAGARLLTRQDQSYTGRSGGLPAAKGTHPFGPSSLAAAA